MYDAVAFDLDGTLLDTEALALEAGLAEARRLGIPLGAEHLRALIGIDQTGSLARLAEWLGGVAAARAAIEAMNAATRERELQGIPLKPGVVEVLEQVGGLGLPLVVVTSSRQSRAIFKLSHCRLSGHFRSLVALEDVERPKPAPEPYLAAARTLDIRPARMLVFEDSEAGVASARAAGATVVQVPDILPAGGLAHFTAPSLMEGARMAGLFR